MGQDEVSRWAVLSCPAHGECGRFSWGGASYTIGGEVCGRIMGDESKAAGRVVRCGGQLTATVETHD